MRRCGSRCLRSRRRSARAGWIRGASTSGSAGGRCGICRPSVPPGEAPDRVPILARVARTSPATAFGSRVVRSSGRQGRVHAGMRPLVERALRIVGALPAAEPVQRTRARARTARRRPARSGRRNPSARTDGLAAGGGSGARSGHRRPSCLVGLERGRRPDLLQRRRAEPALRSARATPRSLPRAIRGTHLVLTYGQLSASVLRWPPGAPCFSCENPSVLIAAERALGEACPPLVCTGGRPSDAVRLLFSSSAARAHDPAPRRLRRGRRPDLPRPRG